MPINFSQQINNRPDIDQLYNEINRLKSVVPSVQPTAYRTVFNDISDEWASCSEDERQFINNDEEYINNNVAYQQQFNAFLLELVGTQFINSPYGKSAENVLQSLKNAKARYKKKASDGVAAIKAENAELQKQLEELKKMIKSSSSSYGGKKNNE